MSGRPKAILEPSFGEGNFLQALKSLQDPDNAPRIKGVEIDHSTFTAAIDSGTLEADNAIHGDFLATASISVDAVIGNPPFVRLRHLPSKESAVARAAIERQMGAPMDPSGSIWMPFVAHATGCLTNGGRLAFVLPFESTYVRYARPLWRFLGFRFSRLKVVRTRERIFPDLLQDVVILLASGKGGSCDHVEYVAFDSVADLLRDRPSTRSNLPIDAIVEGQRSFVWAHLPQEVGALISNRLKCHLVAAKEAVRFNIGYVAGDKTFFHPSPAIRKEYRLNGSSLRPTLNSSRGMRNMGLYTSQLGDNAREFLFYPRQGAGMTDDDLAYVQHGERNGVDRRYKCRIREPWYVVPHVKTPDTVLSVFSERPLLAVNDGSFAASNSVLCGYLRGVGPDHLAQSWYTSLTLLFIELEVHALGGGVMILVPREAGNVRIVRPFQPDQDGLERLNHRLRAGAVEDAYRVGDETVLRAKLGLTRADIDTVRQGVEKLGYWRTSARG